MQLNIDLIAKLDSEQNATTSQRLCLAWKKQYRHLVTNATMSLTNNPVNKW